MSALLTMPRMGETMETGRIAVWLKKPGDSFERGETILEIETDKVTVEMPALDSGRLTEILAPEGAEIAVGAPLGRYDAAGAPAPTAVAALVASAPLSEVTLPRMGETMEEGRLAAWMKRPGERFKRGEVLAEIETDKVTVEMPALADGELVEILAKAGSTVAVGAPIARYRATEAGTVRPAPAPPVAGAPPPASPPPAAPVAALTAPPSPVVDVVGRRRATPLARRLARTAGLDLAALAGSGRRGRIEKRDVEAAAGRPAPAASVQSSMPELRFVSLPQGRMAYREWLPSGAVRRTLLLLHGFSADGGTWAGFAAGLSRGGVRVVVPDLPGHGATAIEAAGLDAVLDPASGFADSLGLGGAEILGHSMGGAVAVRLAAAGRLAPSALTLVAPAGLGGEIDADFVHGMASAATGGALAHLLRRLARHPPALSRPQLEAMASEFARGRLRGLAAELAPGGRQGIDVVADLAALALPVRLVWGVEDRVVPWTQVAAAPSRVAVHLIAGAGHMPHWDKPQDFAALLA